MLKISSKGEESILEEERRYETASKEFQELHDKLENTRRMLFSIVTKITEAKTGGVCTIKDF